MTILSYEIDMARESFGEGGFVDLVDAAMNNRYSIVTGSGKDALIIGIPEKIVIERTGENVYRADFYFKETDA